MRVENETTDGRIRRMRRKNEERRRRARMTDHRTNSDIRRAIHIRARSRHARQSFAAGPRHTRRKSFMVHNHVHVILYINVQRWQNYLCDGSCVVQKKKKTRSERSYAFQLLLRPCHNGYSRMIKTTLDSSSSDFRSIENHCCHHETSPFLHVQSRLSFIFYTSSRLHHRVFLKVVFRLFR